MKEQPGENRRRHDEARDQHLFAGADQFGAQDTPFYGRQAYEAFKGTGAAIGAYIDLAEEAGAEIDIPVAAAAWPSGPVDDKAFEHIADLICESVDRGCDAVMLDLHGAMVTESFDDGEGELVARLRKIDSRVPIAVALDMHANLYESMVRDVTVISGYHTYPHIDVYETGARAGRAILRTARGEVRPTMVWGNRPMLPHVMRQGTDDSPNRELQEMARNAEDSGTVLVASLFTGFPHVTGCWVRPGIGATISSTRSSRSRHPSRARRRCAGGR
jgi:microcystin degradation protein MlrC